MTEDVVEGIVVAETDIEVVNQNRAARVNELQGMIIHSAQNMVQYAIEIGNILIDVKSSLEHGEFMPWVKSNINVHYSTAMDYMKLARKFVNSRSLPDDITSINEALKLIEVKKEQKLLPTRVDSSGNRYQPEATRYLQDGEEEYLDDEYNDEPVEDARITYKPILHDPDIEQCLDAFHLVGAAIFNLAKKVENKAAKPAFLVTARETCFGLLRLTFKLIANIELELNKHGERYEAHDEFVRPVFDN